MQKCTSYSSTTRLMPLKSAEAGNALETRARLVSIFLRRNLTEFVPGPLRRRRSRCILIDVRGPTVRPQNASDRGDAPYHLETLLLDRACTTDAVRPGTTCFRAVVNFD